MGYVWLDWSKLCSLVVFKECFLLNVSYKVKRGLHDKVVKNSESSIYGNKLEHRSENDFQIAKARG